VPASASSEGSTAAEDVRLHLRFGWWALFVFALVGLGLEGLHGFKVGVYLDVSSETRRTLWTLAHAHGVVLALVNIGFGAHVHAGFLRDAGPRRLASQALIAATLLMPAGFALGGAVIHDGAPGMGIVLAPIGGALLLAGLALVAHAAARAR